MASTSTFLRPSSSSFLIAPNVNHKTISSPAHSRVVFRPLRVSASCTSTAERGTSRTTEAAARRRSSLYDVLGIQRGASCQEIKAAYRRMARVLHPDVAGEEESTASEFIKLHEAYETLSDPEKRADYDRSLFRVGRSMSYAFVMSAASGSSGSGLSGYTSRRWETDQCW
ncbi:Chaperone protein dnaJ 11, chloroplastic [Linum perenne]